MGSFSGGRFDLCVTVEGALEADELEFLEEFFQAVSDELHDATDGQHSLGKVLLSPDGFGSGSADLVLQDGLVAYAGAARLWNAEAIQYGRDQLANVTLATHELAHYLYDVRDEYEGPGPAGGPSVTDLACGTSDSESCLMDSRPQGGVTGWYYGTDVKPLADWATMKHLRGTPHVTFKRGQPSEFCHPAPANSSLKHNGDVPNYQNDIHGVSCWETLIDPGADDEKNYGLVLPPAGPVAIPPVPPLPEVSVLIATQRLALVLDRSGSMAGVKFAQLQLAAKFWIDWVEPGEELGILSYSNSPSVDIPLVEVPADPAQELAFAAGNRAVVSALTPGGATAIGDAMRAGLDKLTAFGRAADQVLILVTDGRQNSGTETAADVVPDMIAKGVRLIAVGVGADHDAALLESIAVATAGEYRPIPAGIAADDQAEEIATLLVELAGTLRKESAVLCMKKLEPDAMGAAKERAKEREGRAEVRDVEVHVTRGARSCTLGALWFGSAALHRVELVDPLGRVMGNSTSTRLRGGDEAYAFGTIDAPIAGLWKLRLHGAVEARSRVRVFGFEERPGLRLSVECTPRFPTQRGMLRIVARLHAPMPVPGARMRAIVSDATGWSREIELFPFEPRDLGHSPPHAYMSELELNEDLRGPLTVHVEARHPGGRVRVELDGRDFSRGELEIERAICAVHVPTCVRMKRVVLRVGSGQSETVSFHRGRSTHPAWVPAAQARILAAWSARRRQR